MKPILFSLHAAPGLAERLCREQRLEAGEIERRRFPDGESYVRLLTPVDGRDVVLLSSLDRPDEKTLPLLFAADAARRQGARSIGNAAPYLAYMRQDKAFRPGEAVTSLTYARLLSDHCDWLVTVDPHLHRYPSLADIYSVPAIAASAVAPIAEWIGANVEGPLLIGPDEESAQWVGRIAHLANAPSAVFRKKRSGDLEVSIAGTQLSAPDRATPVIIDDIASSARTMVEAVRALRDGGRPAPFCVAVHAIFAGDAFERLVAAGPAGIVSTNSVAHPSNPIDSAGPLGKALEQALAARSAASASGADQAAPADRPGA